jgi:hypothetical protein
MNVLPRERSTHESLGYKGKQVRDNLRSRLAARLTYEFVEAARPRTATPLQLRSKTA